MIAALVFLIIAGVHVYRLATGFDVIIAGNAVPMTVSWVGLVVALVLGVMLLREAKR
jgi:lipopolysaccharide export LptBFGC system permease protein LptF